MKLRKNKISLIFTALFINIFCFCNLAYGQCSFSGNISVSHSDVISCLGSCSTCTIIIADNAVITIPSGDVWDLATTPGKDVSITIQGTSGVSTGVLHFAGNGGSAAEVLLTTGSAIFIENTDSNNFESLTADNQGNVRITIGTDIYNGTDFNDIIDNGGVDENWPLPPLPVELLKFDADTQQNQIFLSWSTATEINNDYFTLEKSKNGKDFVGMGTVSGNGTTNILSNYSFIDNSPYLSLSFYRLSQTDHDGTTEVFPIISVLFTNTTTNFSISPNPVSSSSVKLKVSGKVKNELLELNIMNMQGRLVEHKYFKADDYGNVETEFQLKKQLQKGTYIFELVSENQKEYLKVIGN